MSHQRKYTMGSRGQCICPKCETKVTHQPGIPCLETQCPKCGAKMLREHSMHHQALVAKKHSKP